MAAFMAGDDPASSPAAIFFAVLGNIASGILILTPLLKVIRIRVNRSVGDTTPYPYLAALFSCSIWVLYALVHHNTLPLLIINSIGVIFEFGYVVVYLTYADEADEDESQWPLVTFVLEALAVGALAVLGKGFGIIAPDTFGYLGAASSIYMFVVPLFTAYAAYKEKKVQEMDPALSAAMLFNATTWFIYGAIAKDYFVLAPNLLGMVSAGSQLAFYVKLRDE